MKTVAIMSQKGGAGKTTLAVHLAVAAEAAGKQSVIVDLDPQASATSWKDLRAGDSPAVVSAQAARLTQVLQAAASHGAHLALIDTAPHSESAALAAARAADMVLIPCRPAILDLKAISNTIDLAKLAKTDIFVVLNAVPSRGSLTEEALAAIKTYDVAIAPVQIVQRAAYVHALTGGKTAQEYEPSGKASKDIQDLYKWLCKRVHV